MRAIDLIELLEEAAQITGKHLEEIEVNFIEPNTQRLTENISNYNIKDNIIIIPLIGT
jgi:hypothetical protein